MLLSALESQLAATLKLCKVVLSEQYNQAFEHNRHDNLVPFHASITLPSLADVDLTKEERTRYAEASYAHLMENYMTTLPERSVSQQFVKSMVYYALAKQLHLEAGRTEGPHTPVNLLFARYVMGSQRLFDDLLEGDCLTPVIEMPAGVSTFRTYTCHALWDVHYYAYLIAWSRNRSAGALQYLERVALLQQTHQHLCKTPRYSQDTIVRLQTKIRVAHNRRKRRNASNQQGLYIVDDLD